MDIEKIAETFGRDSIYDILNRALAEHWRNNKSYKDKNSRLIELENTYPKIHDLIELYKPAPLTLEESRIAAEYLDILYDIHSEEQKIAYAKGFCDGCNHSNSRSK